ncbi:MAG TPA: methylenetetrahydrofolate--tRNA-(uracil(54)-C(5))-methyltransferase (FADH(2)-oxidizing) TrmFO [candidate division WOR-3 bacterium]|uniref:Methylenetetrahydrofolate--tRNA-(uracil-5-)-methyltransferase TrmFO n=1 Tax=candidate division WOR-3 bacterium TaxID=2052148 RepID=A0A7V5HNE6_UNCW3|nr:methylenetetrahydrofolate--tRNA-(uracil(54)-C(5))-methyltransferase (FADH(2)-oxidizing) TrmFO [candidate division WOR-3 bacterium]
MKVHIIGGGLAGSEAALQLAERGIEVILFEMRPVRMTPVHNTEYFAELVCSNSLKSVEVTNAHGLLKEELKILHSYLLEIAKKHSLPGGKALVVDRLKFSWEVTNFIESHPNIQVIREEITSLPPAGIVLIASGPLTSDALAQEIKKLTGDEFLYFFDALSPIVDAESLDFSKLYYKDRHGLDDSSYLNAPLTKEEYYNFVEALLSAEVHIPHLEEEKKYFEGCLPIEVMAKRGPETLRHGPLNPRGLKDPKTGKTPYAVVQLRPENKERTMFSLVGFQTQLKYPEQKRIFRMIPGLENAVFLRYGAVHRNTYIHSPGLLDFHLRLKKDPRIFFAGQLIGTEGYVEAIMGGLIAALNIYNILKRGRPLPPPPETTMIGALLRYIVENDKKDFQPMNANLGLLPPVDFRLKGRAKREIKSKRALRDILKWKEENL